MGQDGRFRYFTAGCTFILSRFALPVHCRTFDKTEPPLASSGSRTMFNDPASDDQDGFGPAHRPGARPDGPRDQHGLNTLEYQPAKLAAIEGRYDTERPTPLTSSASRTTQQRRCEPRSKFRISAASS